MARLRARRGSRRGSGWGSALFVLTALAAASARPFPALAAQAVADTTEETGAPRRPPPLATLYVWADHVWISLLDRDGAPGGRLAEAGVLQRFDPRMDHEYDLDLRAGLFTAGEEAGWARGMGDPEGGAPPSGRSIALGEGGAVRAAAASISHPHVLTLIDWRQGVPVSGPVGVRLRYHREHSLTARRDYPRVGVAWREALGTPWTLEAAVGVHFFKPSADVELTASRSWEDPATRRWEVELGVAALDAFSNTVFNALGVDEEEVEAQLDYDSAPLAARFAVRAGSSRWGLEVHAGATTRSEVEVAFPAGDDLPFSQAERAAFGGVLVQVVPGARWAAALRGTLLRADTERRSAPSGPGGFTLREETASLGLLQRLTVGGDVALVGELDRVWRPERRRVGDLEGIRHRDRATLAQVALERRPSDGWTGRLAWAALDREAGVLLPGLTARNQRLITQGGHRFASGFEITAGVGWDLDALGRSSFDGGHLRFSGRW